MKPYTRKVEKSQPLQKVKDGFERNHMEYTERKDRNCTVLEIKRKERRSGFRQP